MQKSLNDILPAEYEEIKNLAALFFTPREIAMMMSLPSGDFVFACEREGTPAYEAFQGGRLQSEVDHRTSVIKLAKSGSSPAQTMVNDLIAKSKIQMLNK